MCSWMITLHPARVGRHSARSICMTRLPKTYGVISINGALVSLREDHFKVPVAAGYECRAALRCRNREAAVELGDVMLGKKLVGSFQAF